MCAVGIFRGHGVFTRAGVMCARLGVNVLYRLFCLLPRCNEVLFFSRQSNTPTDDFRRLGEQFADEGFASVFMTKKLSARSVLSYAMFAVREIYHLAKCRICIVDRYDPVISLVNLCCKEAIADVPMESILSEQASQAGVASNSGIPVYDRFPEEPIVVQLWHAFGAFKKFGFQSLGGEEGHPVDTARIFCMHRNYTWVICSGQGARVPFAEAFNIPIERVVALPRPEYFDLIEQARKQDPGVSSAWPPITNQPRVLIAPTLRKNHETTHPLRALYESEEWHALERVCSVKWSFHPLEEVGTASGVVNEFLTGADYVVTDYSSIVYEAYLLEKRVAFFVPDLQGYAQTPGLNENPGELCPDLCFSEMDELTNFIVQVESGVLRYPYDQYERFFATAFDSVKHDKRCIVDFIMQQLGEHE